MTPEVRNRKQTRSVPNRRGTVHAFGDGLWPPPKIVETATVLGGTTDDDRPNENRLDALLERLERFDKEESAVRENRGTSFSNRDDDDGGRSKNSARDDRSSEREEMKAPVRHNVDAAIMAARKLNILSRFSQEDEAEMKRRERGERMRKKEIKRNEETEKKNLSSRRRASTTERRGVMTLQKFYRGVISSAVRRIRSGENGQRLKLLNLCKTENLHEEINATTRIQKHFRRYSVRSYFERKRVNAIGTPTKESDKDIAAARVKLDFNNKRLCERSMLIHRWEILQLELKKLVDLQTDWLIFSNSKAEQKSVLFKNRVAGENAQKRKTVIKIENLPEGDSKEIQLEFTVIRLKQHNSVYLLRLQTQILDALKEQMRQLMRLWQKSFVLTQESNKYLGTMETHTKILRSLLNFVNERSDSTSKHPDTGKKYYSEWLHHQRQLMIADLIRYDTDQELLLERETQRLRRETETLGGMHGHLVNSIGLLRAEEKWEAEKIGSELQIERTGKGCDRALRHSEQVNALDKKIKLTRENLLEEQNALQTLYESIEDEIKSSPVDFVGDRHDLEITQMNKITAFMLHRTKEGMDDSIAATDENQIIRRGCEKWMDIFYSQPWIVQQMSEESRLESICEKRKREWIEKDEHVRQKWTRLRYDDRQAGAATKRIDELQRASDQDEVALFKQKEMKQIIFKLRHPLDSYMQTKDKRKEALVSEEERHNLEKERLHEEQEAALDRRSKQNKSVDEFIGLELTHELKDREEIKQQTILLDKEREDLIKQLLNHTFLPNISETDKLLYHCILSRLNEPYNVGDESGMQENPPLKLPSSFNDKIKNRFEIYQHKREDMHCKEKDMNDIIARRKELIEGVKVEVKKEMDLRVVRDLQRDIRGRVEKLKRPAEEKMYLDDSNRNPNNKIDEIKWYKETLREKMVANLPVNKFKRGQQIGDEARDNNDKKAQGEESQKNEEEHSIKEDEIKDTGKSNSKPKSVVSRMKQIIPRRPSMPDDLEELAMMTLIRKRMGHQARKVQAISWIRFTVGKEETDTFATENFEHQERGIPFFRRIKREIGTEDQIVIWVKMSTNQVEFLTSIMPGHATIGHPNHVNLTNKGYQCICHPRMMGHGADPAMCMWYQKDHRASQALSDIALSYSKADELTLSKEGFDKITQVSTETYKLGDAHVWALKIDRASVPRINDLKRMSSELRDYERMLSQTPDDPVLNEMVERMRTRFRLAQIKEEARVASIPASKRNLTDVDYVVEFLALNATDVRKFRTLYDKMDGDRDGFASIDEFAKFIEERPAMRPYTEHIFVVSHGATPTDDRLDFGVTLRAVATFCMMSTGEVLKFIFSIFDKKGYGSISSKNFMDLLGFFHPHHQGRTMRALKEFDFPKDGTGQISFGLFQSLNGRFPNMFFPAYQAQERIRNKFRGVAFWEKKLQKFMSAKKRVRAEEDLSESKANTYVAKTNLDRIRADAEKEKLKKDEENGSADKRRHRKSIAQAALILDENRRRVSQLLTGKVTTHFRRRNNA